MSGPSPEKTLWTGRPSFWNFWPSLAIGDLLILLAAALWWADRARFAPWALAGAAPFYVIAILKRASVAYAVTDQRVRSATGVLGRRVDEVEVGDIRDIVLTQSFFERLVGIGTVTVATAAGEESTLALHGVAGAETVKETIRSARRAAAGGSHE